MRGEEIGHAVKCRNLNTEFTKTAFGAGCAFCSLVDQTLYNAEQFTSSSTGKLR